MKNAYKTTVASFIAEIIHAIFMGIFARGDNINTARVYRSGIMIIVIVLVTFLLVEVF
ncbi:hypothetical protein [Salimicrobium jeotgali]|uniref:hypothetical protein n=1 Tax=Salimicrobium jeotgali TaxID=1230341 RepID=UPI0015E0A28E|nr:hypothetical protein [Salimicrobium jeotgali]